jgi:hypothetical protein
MFLSSKQLHVHTAIMWCPFHKQLQTYLTMRNNKQDKTQGHTGGSMYDLRIGMVTLLEFM